MLKFIDFIITMVKKIQRDRVGTYAAQTAYFIIVSFIPFIMLLVTLLKYLPLTEDTFIDTIIRIVPESASDAVIWLVNEAMSKSSGTLLSITIIMLLWTAGKGIMAMTGGFNAVHDIEETRNYLVLRIISTIHTLLFAIVIILALIFLVFGSRLIALITKYFPPMENILSFVNNIRTIGTFFLLFFFFMLFYKVLPNKKLKFRHQIPGAILASVGWLACSAIFSLYLKLSTNVSYMYGSLATVIVLLLWLYFCMTIIFWGAELNTLLFPQKDEKELRY